MTKHILFSSLILFSLIQFSFGQKTVSPSKPKLVSQMVEKTKQVFPFGQYEEGLLKARKILKAEFEQGLSQNLDLRIDSMKNLTDNEKATLKTKSAEFAQEYAKFIDDLISHDFQMKNWVNESAAKHLNRKYTVAELRKLNNYLESSAGKKTIEAVSNHFAKDFKEKDPQTNPEKSAEFEKIAEKFAETQMGSKFLTIIVENVLTDIQNHVDIWEKKVTGNIEKIVNEKEFTKFLNDFLAKAQRS